MEQNWSRYGRRCRPPLKAGRVDVGSLTMTMLGEH